MSIVLACSPQSLGVFEDDDLTHPKDADSRSEFDVEVGETKAMVDGMVDANAVDVSQAADAIVLKPVPDASMEAWRLPQDGDAVDSASNADVTVDSNPEVGPSLADACPTDADACPTDADACPTDAIDSEPDAPIDAPLLDAVGLTQPPPDVAAWEPRRPTAAHLLTAVSQCQQGEPCVAGYSDGQLFLRSMDSWIRLDEVRIGGSQYATPQLSVSSITVSPHDSKRIYVGYSSVLAGTTSLHHKIWVSGTGGQYWSELSRSPIANVWSLSVNPIDSAWVYAVTDDGIFHSVDYGDTWTENRTAQDPVMLELQADAGTDDTSGVSLVAYGRSRTEVWLATEPTNRLYYKNSQKLRVWTEIPLPTLQGRLVRLAVRLRQGLLPELWIAIVGARDGCLWMTDDNGTSWISKDGLGLPSFVPSASSFVFGLSANPAFPTTLYAIGPGRAWRTDDGGGHWYVPR